MLLHMVLSLSVKIVTEQSLSRIFEPEKREIRPRFRKLQIQEFFDV